MDTLYITCCARNKESAAGLLPAVRRYRSTRIGAVAELAARRKAAFRILSGEYGLLAPDAPIPAYDHLLAADEVTGLVRRVARQLAELAPARVVYVTRTAAADPLATRYHACCVEACALAGIPWRSLEVAAGPLDADALEAT